MRVIYADPGLNNNLGHHANSCRLIRSELRRRGIHVVVLSAVSIDPALQEELQALPLFRANTYWRSDGDPVCGWLNSFAISVRATVDDLSRVPGIVADDIIYLNSAQPAQFMALVTWAKSLPVERRPNIVMEFGTDPGVDVTGEPGHFSFSLKDYRTDPRAMFYRHAASHLNAADLSRFHMITFDSTSSEVYTQLLDKPVGVLPLPQFAQLAVASRVGRHPVTISVLGHQRGEKGYHLMPQIVPMLLTQEPDIRLLLHNGAPEFMQQTQQELRDLAATEPRILLDERTADLEIWEELLNLSDLILCPYEPTRFIASYSAIATEAVAHGIPLVVPAKTTMSRLIETYDNMGTCFDSSDSSSIVDAVMRATADFDTIAARAATAARRWGETMGADNMVTHLLARCGVA